MRQRVPVLILLFLHLALSGVAGSGFLLFKAQRMLDRNRVSALDLCENPPADPDLRQKLDSILLGMLSQVQTSLRVEKRTLELRLNSLFGGAFQYSIPPVMSVYRRTYAFPEDRLGQAVRDSLSVVLRERGLDSARLEVEFLEEVRGLVLPFSPARVTVLPTRGKFLGHQKFTLQFEDEEKVQTLTRVLPAEVRYRATTLVARRDLAAGEKIDATNADLAEKIVRTGRDLDRLTDQADLGKSLVAAIKQGAAIPLSGLVRPFLVHRHQTIPMTLAEGNVRIEGHVIALEDGLPGQRIRLKTRGTNREFQGVVQEDGSILVSL